MKSQKVKSKNRILRLVLGQKVFETLSTVNLLVVGVGGIGCELIKNLSKAGFKLFTILDFDSIQQTNLNRQFYFRSAHIGSPKAVVAKQSLLKIDSSIKVTALNESIYNQKKCNAEFYSQFDIIVSCLDSMKAREFLAKQATKANKPLVDAGTMSYNGQAYPSIRFKTNCHNCNPSSGEASYPICTIRSRPDKPIHCIVYAKAFYESFFGGEDTYSLREELKYEKLLSKSLEEYCDEELKEIGMAIFTKMFDERIKDVDLEGNKIDLVRKLPFEEAILMNQNAVENPKLSTFNQADFAKQQASPYHEEKLLTIAAYTQMFLKAIVRLFRRKDLNQTPHCFEKDDEDCMALVYSMCTLRTYNFMNDCSSYNQHKYLTYYQCKDISGKIFPAIASTNAIAAALQLRQIINISAGRINSCRYISFTNAHQKLWPSLISQPNLHCEVCSERIIYAKVLCNLSTTTFEEFQDFVAKNLFTYHRDVEAGSQLVIKNSSGFDEQSNKKKQLNFNPTIMVGDSIELTFHELSKQTPLRVHITAKDAKLLTEPFLIVETPSKAELRKQILRYYRKAARERCEDFEYEVKSYGY